jgi:hypothetical protein
VVQPGATYAGESNLNLYAQWQINQYTDTFDPNGGEGGGTFTGDYLSSYTTPSATREGYIFMGWYVNGKKIANAGQ